MDTVLLADDIRVYKTSKVALFRLDPNGGLPSVLFVYTKWCPYREAGWYLPGGGEKPEDEGCYIKTACRELLEETGHRVRAEAFSEEYTLRCRPFKSNNKEYNLVSVHYYFVLWDASMDVVPLTDTNEIEKIAWFRLDQIPLPAGKEPSSRKHLHNLRMLLRSLKKTVSETAHWLYGFETSMQSAGLAKPLPCFIETE